MGDTATIFHEQPCCSKSNKAHRLEQDLSFNGGYQLGSIEDSYNLLMFQNRATMPNSADDDARSSDDYNKRIRQAVDINGRPPISNNRYHSKLELKLKNVLQRNTIHLGGSAAASTPTSSQRQPIHHSQLGGKDTTVNPKNGRKIPEFFVPHSVPMPRTASQPSLRSRTMAKHFRTSSQPPGDEGTIDQIKRRRREIEAAKLLIRERMWINIVNLNSKRRRILLRRTENRMRVNENFF